MANFSSPLAGVAREEIGSPEVGAAAVSGARLLHLPGSLPAPREERGQGMGVHVGALTSFGPSLIPVA